MLLKFILISIIIYSSNLIIASNGFYDDCTTAKNCSECIAISYKCSWCEDKEFANGEHRYRCDAEQKLIQSNCPKNKIIGQKTGKPVVKLDEDFSKSMNNIIQLKPQKYEITMRSNSVVKIPIKFKQAAQHPMDLYYLVDLSCTMVDYKINLGIVGDILAKKMKETTENFQIGFGSFVDKPVIPYSSYKLETVKCKSKSGAEVSGEPTYSFLHQLKLVSNGMEFVNAVKNAKTSGNNDSPEGTLDALMQVLVCTPDIGWRDQSHKIIVVATDEEFHYAGDGKLGGILVPNDGKCHMSNNRYTHWHLLDYPSMQQISEKIRENQFNVVFTVSHKVYSIYQTLAKIIGSTAHVAQLEEQGDTIVDVIDRVYKNITSSVELRVERIPDNIEIDFYSSCGNKAYKKTPKCSFIDNNEISFDAEIIVKSCPTDRSLWNQVIKIGLATSNESIEIDLRLICECNCDSASNVKTNAAECSDSGTYACGVCSKCNGIRTGEHCQCDPDQPIDPNDPESHCKTTNITSTCSGAYRGTCVCDRCECKNGYSGKFCQYDDSNCYPNSDITQKLCKGNGKCEAEKCKCVENEYSGKFCDCPNSNQTCIETNQSNGNQSVCSGLGECLCGKCVCKKSSSTGAFCQICPLCESKKYCDLIPECVPKVCEELYGKDNCTEKILKSQENCLKFNYIFVDKLNNNLNSTGGLHRTRHQCEIRTPDNECVIVVKYDRTDDENKNYLSFKLTKEKICAEKVNLTVWSGGLVAGIILVGLALLLIWKLITELLDRKEFARFERELNKANWDQSENPLYKEVTTTFTNPTFGLRQKSMKRLSRLTERFSKRFEKNT